jgi:hypothetical protein
MNLFFGGTQRRGLASEGLVAAFPENRKGACRAHSGTEGQMK